MIIIEGPDGAGKSWLVKQLSNELGIPQHERAVRDRLGPHDVEGTTLWDWAVRDVASWETSDVFLYDRHPLVSEYIYGPVTRGRMAPGFTHPSAQGVRQQIEQQCLLIVCLPPLEVVLENIQKEEQMEGVQENATILYGLYEALLASWPGWPVRYDYTRPSSLLMIKRFVRMHAAQWKGRAS